ncbi:MAG: oligosaccharide flippase family protein [Candidatus Marinimicrobia bacterium]|nr:oligosaccharide flippase family protein [Candidatus Neomarinimicrobiota bacterium]
MGRRKELARGSATVSVITFVGHILSTGLKLLVSRNFGLIGFGQYSLIMAFSRFLSTVVQMGFHQSIVHFISKFRAAQDWANVKHFFISGLLHILKVSLVLILILLLFKDIIINHIDLENGGLYALIFIWALSTIIAINNFISGTLRSLKLFKEQAILFTSSFPALMIMALLGLRVIGADLSTVYQFLAFGVVLNVLLLVVMFIFTLKKFEATDTPPAGKENLKVLMKYSLPIWLSSTLQSASRNSDRIMLGIFSSISQVAIYGAGMTFSILFAFPLKAMSPVFQPSIIEHYASKDYAGINQLYNTMVRWSSLFVIPALSALICFGEQLIKVFGKGFEGAYAVMIILSFAQAVSTIAGIAGTMLDMTEKQASHAKIMIYGFVLVIILNLLLIPRFGAVGAAIASALSILVNNVFRVRKLIKYYSLKTDYGIVIKLILKFTPLVLTSLWIMNQALMHWSILLCIYLIISMGLVYWSLSPRERDYVLAFLRKSSLAP